MIREKEIERYLVKQVEKIGGKAYKWVSPGNPGVPDRMIVFLAYDDFGRTIFVEVKTEDGKLSRQQRIQHARLIKLGYRVYTIRSKAQVDGLIREICEISA